MKKIYSKYISLSLIIFALVFSLISIVSATILRIDRSKYLVKENLEITKFSVEMRDGNNIFGLLYTNPSIMEGENHSNPAILMLNGINAKKEDNFEIAFQLVKWGYTVFSIEQRGHGESEGPSGFLEKEPFDMVEILDFITEKYDFINQTHIGLLGFSYGGGIGAILQALDTRIYSSVLYHPLTSIEILTEQIPFQNLIGTTPCIEDIDTIPDAFNFANASNTQNLLLIHGLEDKLILSESSEKFYTHLNGNEREDIDLELRPFLDHPSNEKDALSLKHTLVWFNSFFIDRTIDNENREEEITQIILFEINYPNTIIPEIFSILTVIFIFLGISIFLIFFKILPKWKERPFESSNQDAEISSKKYKNMIIYRTLVYILPVFIIGPIFMVLNQSFIYSYFIAYPIIASALLIFIPSELHRSWKDEWTSWIKNESLSFLYSVGIVITSVGVFLILFNLNALIMLKPIIPFFNNSLAQYIFLGFGSITMDFLYLREFKQIHSFFLLILRPISLIIFLMFIQLPPFPILGGLLTHIMFIILTGGFLYYIRQLIILLSKFYKSAWALSGLIMLPSIIFFTYIFFRIV